jgi:hypothetical protein
MWKATQSRTAAQSAAPGQMQRVVGSVSVRSATPAATDSGAGGSAPATRWIVPGRAIASRISRKARADWTGASVKPPERAFGRQSFVLSPNHREEIDLGAGGLFGAAAAGAGSLGWPSGCSTCGQIRSAAVGLHQRIDRAAPQRMDPCRGPAPRHGRPRPFASRTEARVTVISPRLKAAPVAPTRPRTITAPISGWRRRYGRQVGISRGKPAGGALASSGHPGLAGRDRVASVICISTG